MKKGVHVPTPVIHPKGHIPRPDVTGRPSVGGLTDFEKDYYRRERDRLSRVIGDDAPPAEDGDDDEAEMVDPADLRPRPTAPSMPQEQETPEKEEPKSFWDKYVVPAGKIALDLAELVVPIVLEYKFATGAPGDGVDISDVRNAVDDAAEAHSMGLLSNSVLSQAGSAVPRLLKGIWDRVVGWFNGESTENRDNEPAVSMEEYPVPDDGVNIGVYPDVEKVNWEGVSARIADDPIYGSVSPDDNATFIPQDVFGDTPVNVLQERVVAPQRTQGITAGVNDTDKPPEQTGLASAAVNVPGEGFTKTVEANHFPAQTYYADQTSLGFLQGVEDIRAKQASSDLEAALASLANTIFSANEVQATTPTDALKSALESASALYSSYMENPPSSADDKQSAANQIQSVCTHLQTLAHHANEPPSQDVLKEEQSAVGQISEIVQRLLDATMGATAAAKVRDIISAESLPIADILDLLQMVRDRGSTDLTSHPVNLTGDQIENLRTAKPYEVIETLRKLGYTREDLQRVLPPGYQLPLSAEDYIVAEWPDPHAQFFDIARSSNKSEQLREYDHNGKLMGELLEFEKVKVLNAKSNEEFQNALQDLVWVICSAVSNNLAGFAFSDYSPELQQRYSKHAKRYYTEIKESYDVYNSFMRGVKRTLQNKKDGCELRKTICGNLKQADNTYKALWEAIRRTVILLGKQTKKDGDYELSGWGMK